MDSDFSMKINLLDDYISKWRKVREGDVVNQLFSETINFLKYCIRDLDAAQKIECCVENVGSVYAIDGHIPPALKVVKEGAVEVICQILQGVKDAIAVPHL